MRLLRWFFRVEREHHYADTETIVYLLNRRMFSVIDD